MQSLIKNRFTDVKTVDTYLLLTNLRPLRESRQLDFGVRYQPSRLNLSYGKANHWQPYAVGPFGYSKWSNCKWLALIGATGKWKHITNSFKQQKCESKKPWNLAERNLMVRNDLPIMDPLIHLSIAPGAIREGESRAVKPPLIEIQVCKMHTCDITQGPGIVAYAAILTFSYSGTAST